MLDKPAAPLRALYWLLNRVPFTVLSLNVAGAILGIPVAIGFLGVEPTTFVAPLILSLLLGQIILLVLLQRGFKRPTGFSITVEVLASSVLAVFVMILIIFAVDENDELSFVEAVERTALIVANPPNWAVLSVVASILLLGILGFIKYRTYRTPHR